MNKGYWFPWCKSDYKMSYCTQQAKELKTQGKKIRIIPRPPEQEMINGKLQWVNYGKIYIWIDE